jgi:uncharacterized protein YbcI
MCGRVVRSEVQPSHGSFPLSRPRVDLHNPQTRRREGKVSGPEEHLTGGALNAALANEVGRFIAEFTGRGAQRSRAFVDQDVVVCVLEDGATNAERNLVSAGRADLVRLQRDALQRAMGPELIELVERLTRRTVRGFLSGSDESGAAAVEVFLLEASS